MWNFPPVESRVKATPKSRKNLAKQKQESSMAAGTGSSSSEAQPDASTTLTAAGPSYTQSPFTSGTTTLTAAGPSNAQSPFMSGTLSVSEESSSTATAAPAAPAAPVAMSNEGNANFSFTSAAATFSVSEGSSSTSTAPAAPVFFGMQRNAEFLLTPSGTISAEESLSTAPAAAPVVMSEPLVFGMQSNAPISFTSGTLPVEDSSLQVAPSVVGTQSNIDPALNAGAEPEEEESIEKMVADMEAELGNPSRITHIPEDPNYGLDITFGLDDGFVPAAIPPNAGQESNATQYPDPTDLASSGSVPYFAQGSNIQQSDLPYSSFIAGLDTAHDPFAPDPFEHDPFASDPFDEVSFAQDPSAHDPSFDQKANFALDPSLDMANETSNIPPFTASAQHHPDPSGTEYSDPNVQDNARSLPHLIQDSRMEDSQDLPRSSLYQDPSSPPGLDIAQDPLAQSSLAQGPLGQVVFAQDAFRQDPFVQDTLAQDPLVQAPLAQAPQAQDPVAQLPWTQVPSAQTPFAQDSLAQDLLAQDPFAQDPFAKDPPAQDPIQDPSLLDPSSDLANAKSDCLPFATSAPPPVPSATQDTSMEELDLAHPISYQDRLTQDHAAQEPLTHDPIAEDPVVKDPVAQGPVAHDSVVAQDPSARDSVAQDPVAHDSILQQESEFPLDPHLGLANDSKLFCHQQCLPQTSSTTSGQHVHGNEDSLLDMMDLEPDYKTTPPSWKHNKLTEQAVTKANAEAKQRMIPAAPLASSNTDSARFSFTSGTVAAEGSSSTAAPVVALSKEEADKYQREIRKLRAEIERKNKQISDRDGKIRRSAWEFQDQDTKNTHLIKQYLNDLDKIRMEKSTLEEANRGLERENLEAQEIQSKAKKDKELIRKLNCELGRIRKKQSALVKENESLAKDCESNAVLKEENCRLRASLDDLRSSRSELVEAKDTIRAQAAEIKISAERIATLSTCIDEMSPKMQWQTEELQEAEERALHEESVSKYYKDRCCLLWDKCNALESAGDSRDTEFAKLEMEKEQRHTKELEALNLRIRGLEVANKRLAQGAKDVGGSAETKEADKVDEIAFDT